MKCSYRRERRMKRVIQALLIVMLLTACDQENAQKPEILNDVIVTSDSTYEVILEENIIYGKGLRHQTLNSSTSTVLDLSLDVYRPVNDSEKRPAIILIHGGGFIGGSRKNPNLVNLANYFASRGWVAFSISYRLMFDKGTVPNEWVEYAQNNVDPTKFSQFLAIYPANRDAKAAIRWVIAHAADYNIDPNYITVGGGSAGAIIASAAGITNLEDYTNEISVITDTTILTTNLDQAYTVKTVLDFWGSDVAVDIIEYVYGYQRFDSTDATIFIAHGTQDTTVEYSNAEELQSEYISSGVDYKLYPLVGKGHGPWHATINGIRLEKLAFDFIIEQQNLTVGNKEIINSN